LLAKSESPAHAGLSFCARLSIEFIILALLPMRHAENG